MFRRFFQIKNMKKNITYKIVFVLAAPFLMMFSMYLLVFPTQAAGNILYVNHAAVGGSGDGRSWANAYTDLQVALSAAQAGDEVWVAFGIYVPGTTVSHTFQLTDGVAIYGGFAATETVRSERDWVKNITVLSGDVDGDDTNTAPHGVIMSTTHIVGNNSYHVVNSSGVTTTAVLDGFTITAGHANVGQSVRSNGGDQHGDGGGLYSLNGSPTLNHITFAGNFAIENGGGMFNHTGHPVLNDVSFYNNQSIYGGGLFNHAGHPTLTNGIFSGNRSVFGGGLATGMGEMVLTNVAFYGNVASNRGGGIVTVRDRSILTNVIFSGNSSLAGGGWINQGSQAMLTNVTFSGNFATHGGGIVNIDSDLILTNSIVWGNKAITGTNILNVETATLVVSHSLIEGSGGSGANWVGAVGTDGGNNIDRAPLFIRPIDATHAPTTTGNLQLGAGSPAIDAGNTLSYTNATSTTTDLVGYARVQNGVIDMGAYEFVVHYPLKTAVNGDGAGSIKRSPNAISYTHGTTVTLVATADSDSAFTGWSGDCSGTGRCVVEVTAAKSITATFTRIRYPIYLPVITRPQK